MKAIAIIKYVFPMVIVLPLVAILNGCIAEDLEACKVDQVLYLKVVDSQGRDITKEGTVDTADIYVFADDGKFVEKLSLTKDEIVGQESIRLSTPGSVVVWGNVRDREEISQMNANSTVANSAIKLKRDITGISNTPDDIFYGSRKISLLSNSRKTQANEIVISRKVARMHITVRGLESTNNSDYYFGISQKNNGYTFDGMPTKESSFIKEIGIFNAHNDFVSQSAFNLIHSVEGANEGTVVRVFDKTGRELAAADKDVNNRLITPKADETVNVMIDLSNGTLIILVEVTSWDEIFQWVEQ